ncbi:MAG: hypothetical protein HUJ29_08065 [Gammaproteobacteria bacterium]|nr:hypothetical protein [Gammaproteobacteria bacterium]
MKFKLSLESLLSIALIIFFFMPWLKVAGGLINYTGYEIPYTGKTVQLLFSSETYSGGTNFMAYLAYLIYLVPVLAALTIYLDLFSRKVSRLLPLLAAAIPVVIFIAMLIKLQLGAFDHYDIGLYLSVLISVVIILDYFGLINMADMVKGKRR